MKLLQREPHSVSEKHNSMRQQDKKSLPSCFFNLQSLVSSYEVTQRKHATGLQYGTIKTSDWLASENANVEER